MINDPQVQEGIYDILEQYKYSDVENLTGTSGVVFDAQKKTVTLVGYIPENYIYRDNNGTCLKLALRTLEDINKKFEGLNLTVVKGNDPVFFKKQNKGEHYFLVDANKEWVIDPSFKKVVHFEESGYQITNQGKTKYNFKKKELVMNSFETIPIFQHEEGLVKLWFKVNGDDCYLTLFTEKIDGNDFLNYNVGKNIKTGEFIPDIKEPMHEIEEKLIDLVKNAKVVNNGRR